MQMTAVLSYILSTFLLLVALSAPSLYSQWKEVAPYFSSNWKDIPASKTVLESVQMPYEEVLQGNPPESGIRYWDANFKELNIVNACYSAVTLEKGADGGTTCEQWNNTWDGPGMRDHRIVLRRGASLEKLGPPRNICDSSIINDVPDLKDPSKLSPNRGFTRLSTVIKDKAGGEVIMACVCPDYIGGSSLFPALLYSKDADPSAFKYLGKIHGEPAEINSKKCIWSDGGTLVQMDGGRWRMYFNGFGPVLSAVESDSLEGDWKFLRDEKGEIRELVSGYPRKGGCFPTVLKVANDNWHLWISDGWPPQSIWHFWSNDGLSWKPYGKQPEITRKAFNKHPIKCMRAFLSEDGREIIGLLSIFNVTSQSPWGMVMNG